MVLLLPFWGGMRWDGKSTISLYVRPVPSGRKRFASDIWPPISSALPWQPFVTANVMLRGARLLARPLQRQVGPQVPIGEPQSMKGDANTETPASNWRFLDEVAVAPRQTFVLLSRARCDAYALPLDGIDPRGNEGSRSHRRLEPTFLSKVRPRPDCSPNKRRVLDCSCGLPGMPQPEDQ